MSARSAVLSKQLRVEFMKENRGGPGLGSASGRKKIGAIDVK
jgi:hypothetical protein